MKFKLTKNVKIVLLIGILFILVGFGSYKVYFERLFIFQENEKIFLKSVENYFVINKAFLPKPGDYKTVTLQDMYDNALIEAVHIPNSGKFCSEDKSFVRAINENGVIRYVVYLDCGKFKSKVDYTSPVIVLNGDKKVIVNLYDNYTDEGIKTVVDDYDGVIDNSKVEVYNNVDTSKTGNYKIVYKIYDKNFNVTREVRDVVVADNLNNIVKRDTNNENYYKGNVENNYLLFSGMLFRIVKINDDGSVKIVSDELKKNTHAYDNTKLEYERLEAELEQYTADIDAKKEQKTRLLVQIQEKEGEIKLIQEKISSMLFSDSHYKQREEALAADCEERKKDISKYDKELKNVSSSLEELKEQQNDSMEELQEIRSRLNDYTKIIEKCKQNECSK